MNKLPVKIDQGFAAINIYYFMPPLFNIAVQRI